MLHPPFFCRLLQSTDPLLIRIEKRSSCGCAAMAVTDLSDWLLASVVAFASASSPYCASGKAERVNRYQKQTEEAIVWTESAYLSC